MNLSYDVYYKDEAIREDAKTLRTNIGFAGIDKPIRSVAITSTQKAEGKTFIATCLAIASSEAGKKTLIIDNDFRSPQIANIFMVRSAHTLQEILIAKDEDIKEFCSPTQIPRLSVMDLGSRRISNPVELLSSVRYKHLLHKAFEAFDFVIVDTPPLGQYIDAAVIAAQVDGVIMTIASGKTNASDIKEVLAQLEKAKAHLLGAVLNGVKHNRSNYYYDKEENKKMAGVFRRKI